MCGIHVSLNQQVAPPCYSPCSQKPMEIPNTFLSPQSQQLHILQEKIYKKKKKKKKKKKCKLVMTQQHREQSSFSTNNNQN